MSRRWLTSRPMQQTSSPSDMARTAISSTGTTRPSSLRYSPRHAHPAGKSLRRKLPQPLSAVFIQPLQKNVRRNVPRAGQFKTMPGGGIRKAHKPLAIRQQNHVREASVRLR